MVQFKERGARAALKKAIAQCDWDEAIQQGISVLAGESLGRANADRDGHGLRRHHEPGGCFRRRDLRRLRTVLLEVRLRRVSQRQARFEVCRQLAEALTKRERYVEAINFWHKVRTRSARRRIAQAVHRHDYRLAASGQGSQVRGGQARTPANRAPASRRNSRTRIASSSGSSETRKILPPTTSWRICT